MIKSMNSFKDIAYQILKDGEEPLHSKEITKIVLERGWLKTVCRNKQADLRLRYWIPAYTGMTERR